MNCPGPEGGGIIQRTEPICGFLTTLEAIGGLIITGDGYGHLIMDTTGIPMTPGTHSHTITAGGIMILSGDGIGCRDTDGRLHG